MEWLNDVWLFFSLPALFIIYNLIFGRGNLAKNYKIVRESNTLGEEKYEVWFDYPGLCTPWRREGEFGSEQSVDEFIARQFKLREIIKQGKFDS